MVVWMVMGLVEPLTEFVQSGVERLQVSCQHEPGSIWCPLNRGEAGADDGCWEFAVAHFDSMDFQHGSNLERLRL